MPSTFTIQTPHHKLQGLKYAISDAKAAVLIIHGFGEHQKRYTHMAELFNAHKLTAYSIDLSGHGSSEGKRGFFPNMAHFYEEIDAALELMRAEGSTRVFLLGHSMGGLASASYVLERQPQLSGLILSSPWFQLALDPPKWQVLLAQLLVKLNIRITQTARFNVDYLSSDLSVGKAYLEDELVHGKMTPQAFYSILESGTLCIQNASALTLPCLVSHGTDDRIISIEGSRTFAEKSGAQFTAFENARHEPHNEPNGHDFIEVYAKWIDARLS